MKLSPADCSLDDYLLPSSFDASAQPNVDKCTLHTVSGAASLSRSEGDCPQSMIIRDRGTSILVSKFRARLLCKNWKNDIVRCTQPTAKERSVVLRLDLKNGAELHRPYFSVRLCQTLSGWLERLVTGRAAVREDLGSGTTRMW